MWHIDSYDKLKPYGICINDYIDGYFVEAFERCEACPRLVQTDMGTKNVVIRDIQQSLRRNDVDGRAAERSLNTGVSTTSMWAWSR